MINEKIEGLFTSKPNFVRPNGQLSAIQKNQVSELIVHSEYIEGDEVANKKHHGGDKRLIHHYSSANYEKLQEEFPNQSHLFKPGSLGENITSSKLTEDDVFLGDIFKIGPVKMELTIPRSPCATIDEYYGFRGPLKFITQSGNFGWFYRVITPGVIKDSDRLILIERPNPNLKLSELIHGCFKRIKLDSSFINKALSLDSLDHTWREKLRKLH